jgi:hypothetical protein
MWPRCTLSFDRSPKASRKPRRTLVDPTFAANERGKRFTMQFVFGTVTEHARPLGSCSLLDLSGIGGAADDRGERFVGSWQIQPVQLQRPPCPTDGAIFCLPPHHKVEHRAEVAIDCVAITAGLALLPSIAHPEQILPQRFPGIWDSVLNGPVRLPSKTSGTVHPSTFIAQCVHGKSAKSRLAPRVRHRPSVTASRGLPSKRSGPWRLGSVRSWHF